MRYAGVRGLGVQHWCVCNPHYCGQWQEGLGVGLSGLGESMALALPPAAPPVADDYDGREERREAY